MIYKKVCIINYCNPSNITWLIMESTEHTSGNFLNTYESEYHFTSTEPTLINIRIR